MTQANPIIGANKSGLQYRTDDNDGKRALLNHHKGSVAPTYAEAGTLWLDDVATPWLMKMHDGTDWITIGEVNATTNNFAPYISGSVLGDAGTTVKGLVERATDAEASAGTDTTRYITPKQVKDNYSLGSNLLHIQDQKTSNVDGGTSSVGANTRVLNTVVTNEITGASLASNQITLSVGTYEISATAPSWNSNAATAYSQLYLYNTSDSTVEIYGTSQYSSSTTGNSSVDTSAVRGRFTIVGTKTFELRHYMSNAETTFGLGVGASNGLEIYADLIIRKIS